MGARVVTVNDVLDGHVALDIQCLDRIYLNGYVPKLQTSAQVVAFLTSHLGFGFPSPALFNQIGQRFRRAVASYAEADDIPWVKFGKGEDKLAVMRPHLARQAGTGRSGVAGIGVAQEFQRVWTANERQTAGGAVQWSFTKADRRVTCYYFYLWDADFGPGFIKVCAYFPYPAKIWINGHEWAKRQAVKAGSPPPSRAGEREPVEAAQLARAVLDAWRGLGSERRDLYRGEALEMHLVLGHSLADRSASRAAAAYEDGLSVAKTDDDQARMLIALGALLYQHGEFSHALSTLDRGLQLADISAAHRMYLTTDKAWILARQGMHDLALEMLDRALAAHPEITDADVVGRLLDRKASILGHSGRATEGLQFVGQAHEHAIQNKNPSLLAQVLTHQGRLLLQTGQPLRALETLEEALVVARSIPDRYGESVIQWVRSDVLTTIDDLDGALAANREEEKLLRSIGNPRHLATCRQRGRAIHALRRGRSQR